LRIRIQEGKNTHKNKKNTGTQEFLITSQDLEKAYNFEILPTPNLGPHWSVPSEEAERESPHH